MIRVAIVGATGYSALELIKILLRHPGAAISVLTSRQPERPHIADVHPALRGRLDLHCEPLAEEELSAQADCVFSCLPHGVATAFVPKLLAAGTAIVDLSADYRLKDPAEFAKWYATEHHDTSSLAQAVYGLPELFRSEIQTAKLVANPGCYPTSAALALAPLIQAGLVEPSDIIVDSKSGVTGAGRTAKLAYHFPECNESFSAYGVGQHRHTPEIEQTLRLFTGKSVSLIFTPHLVPMDRGILTTTYSRPTRSLTTTDVLHCLASAYEREPFVRVEERLPATKDSSHTNFCDITARVVKDRVVTISCLDNLIKGAAGQAVQNMNILFGQEETLGLM